jgi:hypothetical protein
MEFTFYHIVSIVATVFLILLLTMIGLAFNKSKGQNFPPSKNTCPDYWIADNTDPEKTVCKITGSNMGKITKGTDGSYLMSANKEANKAHTPGYNAASMSVNFSDALWPAAFGSSGQCSLKKWANKYEISWDGIANFNNC